MSASHFGQFINNMFSSVSFPENRPFINRFTKRKTAGQDNIDDCDLYFLLYCPDCLLIIAIPQGIHQKGQHQLYSRKNRRQRDEFLIIPLTMTNTAFDPTQQSMYHYIAKVIPCQGVPSLSRKVIVKNIAPSYVSQIAFPHRVALGSAFPTEQVAGRSVLKKMSQLLGYC